MDHVITHSKTLHWMCARVCACVHVCSGSLTLKTDDGDILLDYSKNLITDEVMKMLVDLVNVFNSGNEAGIISIFCCNCKQNLKSRLITHFITCIANILLLSVLLYLIFSSG